MLDAEYFKLFFAQTETAQHKSVAAKGIDRVDTHTAHNLFNLVIPSVDEIFNSFMSDFGIESPCQIGALCCDAPIAFARVAGLAHI